MNFNILQLDRTSSTNDYLKKLIQEQKLNEGFVALTKNQTSGKGQGANSWESEPNKNLTFSLLLQPTFLPAEKMFLVSKVIALGIIDFLNNLGNTFKIKWPNDIYYQNKKIAGILIENQLLGCCINTSIIGIGLNINQEVFLSDAPNPVSLIQIFNKVFDNQLVLKKLLDQIGKWYQILSEGSYEKINQLYFQHLYRNSGYHDFLEGDKIVNAKIVDIKEDGQLIIRTKARENKSFYFKEIEFII